jgi:16S rRNA (cytosine967-C5)-methyltransferase
VSSGSTARSVALDVILRVTEHGAYSNLALPRTIKRARLSSRDAALASELAYGTIRRLIPIDAALAPHLDRPLDTAPAKARALLRLGAYQLVYTRIPAHAAVSETVRLAEARHRGFVNAVLRRVATAGSEEPQGADDEAVSRRTGLVAWAVHELRRLRPDDVESAAAALAERAPLTVRTNRHRVSVDELERAFEEAGVRTTRGTVHPSSLLVEAGAPSELQGFAEGWFAVQDQASAFVVTVLDPKPGERVLDVCAGPGGKTGHIAESVEPGGSVVGADVSLPRVRLVRQGLARLGARGSLLVQDGRRPALAGSFDRVLVDAPCSGIGSARRRPELLWRAEPKEVAGLARLQVGIASAAAGMVKPGGRLVYSVCTFPKAETDAACDTIIRRCPDLEPEATDGPDGPAERHRLWPHLHGTDAMFVASFRRKG